MTERVSKKLLLMIGKILVSIFLLWFLIHTAQLNFELFGNIFSHPFLLMSVIFVFLVMIPLAAWRWYILNLSQGINISF